MATSVDGVVAVDKQKIERVAGSGIVLRIAGPDLDTIRDAEPSEISLELLQQWPVLDRIVDALRYGAGVERIEGVNDAAAQAARDADGRLAFPAADFEQSCVGR